MKKTQLKKEDVLQLIKEESYVLARKKELYGIVQQINEELSGLNKLGLGKIGLNERAFIGGYGFKDGNTGTGFVEPQNISHIAQLEKEMGVEPESEENVIVVEPVTDKPMIDVTETKPMIDSDVKKQLIDMKEKIDVLLNSME
jgi:hypothetical protein